MSLLSQPRGERGRLRQSAHVLDACTSRPGSKEFEQLRHFPAQTSGSLSCCGRRAGTDSRQDCFVSIFGELPVVVRLKVEPDLCGPCEVAGKADGGVRGEGAAAFHDFVDAARRNADVLCQAVFGKSQWDEEILAEDFTGVNRSVSFHE